MLHAPDRIKLAFIRSIVLLLICLVVPARVDAELAQQLRDLFGTSAQTPHPAVVRVVAHESDASSMGSGCLIWVDGDYGWVISNWHVVRSATGPIEVIFPDGFSSPAQVIRTDETWDLALLGIWRPRVSPITLSNRIPQVGDDLTIAGYGKGSYRQARGTCRHYVAPDPSKPQEMIELAASARQGDSGGPILNSQGELAGVLFGTGDGLTTGSHIGRVKKFLADASTTKIAATQQLLQPRQVNGSIPSTGPPAFAAIGKTPSATDPAVATVPPPFYPSAQTQKPADDQLVTQPLSVEELDSLRIGESDPLPFGDLVTEQGEQIAGRQSLPAASATEVPQRVARLDDPADGGWKPRAVDSKRMSEESSGDRNPLLLEVPASLANRSPAEISLPSQADQTQAIQLPLPLTDTNAFLVFLSLVATLIYALPRGTSK